MPSEQEKLRTDSEKKKKQDRGLRGAQGGEASFAAKGKPIHFDENTIYDDSWEHWVRNRPGVIKRNRRPKTALEKKHVREALYTAGIGASGGVGYTVGKIVGSRGNHPPEEPKPHWKETRPHRGPTVAAEHIPWKKVVHDLEEHEDLSYLVQLSERLANPQNF
jgi:hypothetical protein